MKNLNEAILGRPTTLCLNPIKTRLFLLSMPREGVDSTPALSELITFKSAYNRDSVFAQINAELIFQSNCILLVMIR